MERMFSGNKLLIRTINLRLTIPSRPLQSTTEVIKNFKDICFINFRRWIIIICNITHGNAHTSLQIHYYPCNPPYYQQYHHNFPQQYPNSYVLPPIPPDTAAPPTEARLPAALPTEVRTEDTVSTGGGFTLVHTRVKTGPAAALVKETRSKAALHKETCSDLEHPTEVSSVAVLPTEAPTVAASDDKRQPAARQTSR